MTLLTNSSTADWIALGPRLVGATFIWAGAIKAYAPHNFRTHLNSLGWIPRNLAEPAVTAAAGLEVAWGIALLTGIAPAFFYPATVGLLIALTFISWWGVHTGKAEDCGCYGGYIQPSIGQSAGLNGLFAALCIIASFATIPTTGAALWQGALIGVGGIVAAAVAEYALRFERKTGQVKFQKSPLQVGNRWRDSWADGLTSRIEGEMLVAFLGPNCPYCTQFVKVANVIVQSPELPRVVGVVAASNEKASEYIKDNRINFPVARVSQSLMNRLARAVPTAVVVDRGKIQNMWIGNMPPTFVDRFRDAFFPNAAESAAKPEPQNAAVT